MPPHGITELLPGYINPILGAGKDIDSIAALAVIFQFPFDLLSYSRLQFTQLPLLPIHNPLPPCLVCQTWIHKLYLTNISHYERPVSFPTHNFPSASNMLSLCPLQLSKLPASQLLMHLIRLLEYVMLTGNCNYVPPTPAS